MLLNQWLLIPTFFFYPIASLLLLARLHMRLTQPVSYLSQSDNYSLMF